MSNDVESNPKIIFRKGPNVTLRPFYESDLEEAWRMINDPRNTRFLSANTPMQLEDQRAFFESARNGDSENIILAIEVAGTYIGSMGLHHVDHLHGTAETGALIGNSHFQGKGYGTEAKLLLLEYAFNQLNLRKIYSEVIAFNERSLKYAARSGYVEEARLKDHFFAGGSYHDKVVLSVNRARWQPLWDAFYAIHGDQILV